MIASTFSGAAGSVRPKQRFVQTIRDRAAHLRSARSASASGRSWRVAVGSLLVLSAWLVIPGSAYAFECPQPQKLARPGVLQESSARTAELTSVLASGDAGNAVPIIVADLRRRYPGVENAEIANYLITAYCPAVARLAGLSDAEKGANLEQFEARITRTIYSERALAVPRSG